MIKENSAIKEDFPRFSIEETIGPLNEFERKNNPGFAYYSGDLGLLKNGGRVSVVGSRKPSPEGERRAKKISRMLVENGIIVVSGLADGIDAVAHNTAIATGGKTIAVLGTPLDNPYPKVNIPLFNEIVANHLAISQFKAGYPSMPKNFPIRNRTMALISHATIIVEASEKSGTIHQGWEALRLGRPLYIMKSLVDNKNLSWPSEFLKYGADILSDDNFEEMIYMIPNSSIDETTHFEFAG